MMNFQQALKALELDYQANWADLKLPAKGSDNSPQQEKAIQVIELIYQYPQNREVCLILEATPKELRQQFLNDRSPDYLNTLAQSIPFLKCNQLWQDLESKGINIPYSQADLKLKGEALVERGQQLYGTVASNIPEPVSAAANSVKGWLWAGYGLMSQKIGSLSQNIQMQLGYDTDTQQAVKDTEEEKQQISVLEIEEDIDSTQKLQELLGGYMPEDGMATPKNSPVKGGTVAKTPDLSNIAEEEQLGDTSPKDQQELDSPRVAI